MKSTTADIIFALTVLGLVSAVVAHGDDEMDMKMGAADQPHPEDAYPPTYFALRDHSNIIYAHMGLMTVAWVFMLPPGKTLSLAVVM
jgi:hypothetical protein